MSYHHEVEADDEWHKIGLTSPARKALVDARLYKVSDLRKISLEELTQFQGMSKSAIARICVIMNAKKIHFKN
jgi:DNA-binding transcriptional MerR regulator